MLKTISVDITRSVFDNDTEAVLYITKDIYTDSFIAAVPVITLSWQIWEANKEREYDWMLKANIGIGDPVRKQKLVDAIKEAIAEFE